MKAQVQEKATPQTADDNAKRRQITEGARAIFLQQGFDAGSVSLGLDVGTVKAHMFRAVTKLRLELRGARAGRHLLR